MGMKIDTTTKLEDSSGSTLELDHSEDGITLRSKNGKPFTLETREDADVFLDMLTKLVGTVEFPQTSLEDSPAPARVPRDSHQA